MRLLSTLLAIAFAAVTATAQPQISYIFPDIGAAGMNTYVEIIGPANAPQNFGNTDKLYDANDLALRVEPATPNDAQYLVIGPHVVSWRGRMISTQIFVKPNAPPATYFFVVILNGRSTAPIAFNVIVPPTISLTGGGVLGNGGASGTRSARGAMIVDQLTLGTGTYTVNIADRDLATAGEQGLLPFVLISRKPIVIQSGAVIALNASGRNAAPGGGGGGGQICDCNVLGGGGPSGTAGGWGFTGGAWGGRNGAGAFPPVSHVIQSNGLSSGGTSPNALNGALGGQPQPCGPESAGGGTGHPFGIGGVSTCNALTTGAAGYGGGGGASNNSPGAGGGFGGIGGNGGGNGGQIHGNKQGVPLAGGSGASSANPQTSGKCAGDGGGGGGAFALYSQVSITNNGTIQAIGGTGGNGDPGVPGGGGGSGGMILIGAKDTASVGGTLNTTAGAGGAPNGGGGANGRARYDGFYDFNATTTPTMISAATSYVGPTIDTLSYVRTKTFTIRGTQDVDGDIRIWIKGDNAFAQWTNLTVPPTSVTRIGRRWSFRITVPTGGFYYVVAAQFVPTPSEVDYNREPIWVLSQAAANIIYADIIPEINGDSVKYFGTLACGTSKLDSFRIWNEGSADLVVQAPTPNPSGDFTVIRPTFPRTLLPNDSIWVYVRFTPTAAGVRTATMTFANNDPRTIQGEPRPRAQWQVRFQGTKLNLQPSLSRRLIDFGDVCRDSLKSEWLEYLWTGDTTSFVRRITRLGTGPADFSIISPTTFPTPTIPAGTGSTRITVQFRPTSAGAFRDSFAVVVSPCDTTLVFVVQGRAVETIVDVTPNPVNFGAVRVGLSSTIPVTLTNRGTSTVTIGRVFFRPPGPPFSVPVQPTGTVMAPGSTATFNVQFSPIDTGIANASMCIPLLGNCADTVCVPVTGIGIQSQLVLSRNQIELRADPCLDPAPDVVDTFKLRNIGTAADSILSVAAINGLVVVTSRPPLPAVLLRDEEVIFTVRWTPGAPGTQAETIRITTSSSTQPTLDVQLRLVRDLSKVLVLDSAANPVQPPIEFGVLNGCNRPGVQRVIVRNDGTLDESVTGTFVDGRAFSLNPTSPMSVGAKSDLQLQVLFAPTSNGEYFDTLIVRNQRCPGDIRIPVHGWYSALTYTGTGQNFGTMNVGQTATGTAFLRFDPTSPNTLRSVVRSAYINPPTGTPFTIISSNLPDTLAPGEVTSVQVGFTPPAVQNYAAEICFVISEPCPDTICVPLTGSGIQSNLLVRQSTLNFGTLFVCEDSTLDITIENTGSAPVDISDLRLGGPDAVAFERVTPMTFPARLDGGAILSVTYRFVPARAAADGMQTATVEIISNDPTRPSIIVNLVGERRRQLLATPAILDFGQVVVGTSRDIPMLLESRTAQPVRIDAWRLPPPFSVVSPAAPVVIPPFGSITVIVRFTPTAAPQVDATLVAEHGQPCIDSTLVPLTGRGRVIERATVTIVIPDSLHGAPGDLLPIPLIMTSVDRMAESDATTFVATIRFDRALLWPERARTWSQPIGKAVAGSATTGGRIVDVHTEGEQRVVTLEIANNPMVTAPDTLGYLDATVLIADHLATPITFDSLGFTDGPVTVNTIDGSFSLVGYCIVGDTRLVHITGASGFKSVAPNPFDATTEILFETVEAGPTSLSIYDASGAVVERLLDRAEIATGPHLMSWSATNRPSGMYMVELRTPTERHVHPVILVK